MKYLLGCCGRIVETDNMPVWCIRCGAHRIKVTEFTDETMLSDVFKIVNPETVCVCVIAIFKIYFMFYLFEKRL